MATLTSNGTGLSFTEPNQQWIIASGVVVATTVANADAVTVGSAGAQLINFGTISATGGGTFLPRGVFLQSGSHNATVINGDGGTIIGRIGVETRASDFKLFNDGTIFGTDLYGVEIGGFQPQFEIRNAGHLHGKVAAIHGAEVIGPVTIHNSGLIESAGAGIALDASDVSIVNTGTIDAHGEGISVRGGGAGVLDNTGDILGNVRLELFAGVRVLNHGLIRGDLILSDDSDVYNGRRGVVDGEIHGGVDKDVLKGGGDDDELFGDAQADELFGSGGDDKLAGGERGDKMKGGGGDDAFVYLDLEDSYGGGFESSRDTILGFRAREDVIDLSRIDTRPGGDDNRFKFIGEAEFTGGPGELRYFIDSGDAIVQANLKADGDDLFEIRIKDMASLSAGDFDL